MNRPTREALVETLLAAGVFTDADNNHVFCTQVADALLAGPLRPTDRDQLITALAQMMTGLQVPASLNEPQLLGAAYEPWITVRRLLNIDGMGWTSENEIETELRTILG